MKNGRSAAGEVVRLQTRDEPLRIVHGLAVFRLLSST
jgi:hypothetical protein